MELSPTVLSGLKYIDEHAIAAVVLGSDVISEKCTNVGVGVCVGVTVFVGVTVGVTVFVGVGVGVGGVKQSPIYSIVIAALGVYDIDCDVFNDPY